MKNTETLQSRLVKFYNLSHDHRLENHLIKVLNTHAVELHQDGSISVNDVIFAHDLDVRDFAFQIRDVLKDNLDYFARIKEIAGKCYELQREIEQLGKLPHNGSTKDNNYLLNKLLDRSQQTLSNEYESLNAIANMYDGRLV